MNAHNRVLLLAEIFDADVDKYIFHILQSIENSPEYRELLKNVEKAKSYNAPYSEAFLKMYNDMKNSKISTIKEALFAQATINHLSHISKPRYFINPLLYNANEMTSSLKYIDELPCLASSREVSIENMIKDKNIPTQEKLKVINKVCTNYHDIAKETVIDKISEFAIKKDKFLYKKNRNTFYWTDISLSIFLNFYLIITLFSQDQVFKRIKLSEQLSITGILYIVFFGLLFAYESISLLIYLLNQRTNNEKNYCYKYLLRNRRRAYRALEEGTQKIRLALLHNLKEKNVYRKTSLTKYNYLKNYRRIILYLEKDEEKKTMKGVKSFFYIKITILTLLIISFIALLVFTLIAVGSGRVI